MDTTVAYVNEHLLAGWAGRITVALAFAAALLSAYAGWRATQADRRGDGESTRRWSALTGGSYAVMGLGIVGVIALLLTMMTQQWYEYQYVQQHVNDELPFRYVFTAFWEGQEGSFLLWLFWHAVLGGAVWLTSVPRWRLPVLAVLAAVQAVLLSMLLGVYLPFGEAARVGSSPFNLLREVMDAPIFGQADYVALIEGTGLNPLLQNYWMLIHPPTLFLGFASVTVPFAFAVAGLWRREHLDWMRAALTWSLLSAGILGIGILMGGAWAYEALNFGGYWAWDPVENTSLVPWILLVAGIHTLLVARSTGHSVRASYLFLVLAFVAVLYSSLLTRSGLLGETSVHAFTEMGLEAQLIFLTGGFAALGLGLLAYRWREIPAKATEERLDSREFWMFLGSLVLLFSAASITASTSLPVVNKLGDALGLGLPHLTLDEPVAHYNKYQLWVGVFVGLFTGLGNYLRWRRTPFAGRRGLAVRMAAGAAVALGLAYATHAQLHVQGPHFLALAFAAYWALIANLDYLVTSKVRMWRRLGSVVAHGGFAVMLIGILFSGLNQRHISENRFAMDGILGEEQIGKNVLLVRGLPMVINGYEVTYLSDTLIGNRREYAIRYRELSREGVLGQEFTLRPYALYTNDFAKVASMNPDTRHYWDHDVFTHITGLPPSAQSAELAAAAEDSLRFEQLTLRVGEETDAGEYTVALLGVDDAPTHPDYESEPGDVALGLRLGVQGSELDTVSVAEPVVVLRENLVYSYPVQIDPLGVRVRVPEEAFARRYPADDSIAYRDVELGVGETARIGEATFRFAAFEREVDHTAYVPQEGDIAVGGRLEVDLPGAAPASLTPVYLIRESRPMDLRAFDAGRGLHARLVGLDPATERARLLLAYDPAGAAAPLPVEIATNAQRTDWVVLEATVFPGINLFWAGSIAMLLGLLVSFGFRLREKFERLRAQRLAAAPEPAIAGTPARARSTEHVEA